MNTRPPDSDRMSIVTANKRGRTSGALNEVSELFAAFAANARAPVLDLGCAFGVATLAALRAGATVTANDISAEHLRAVELEATPDDRTRLTTVLGAFPAELDFAGESFAAVHASNLLNFLTGREIESGSIKIARWLQRGGRLFVISGTPYANNIKNFIPEYEARRARGDLWPGECEPLSRWSDDPTIAELPSFLNLLDEVVLARTFAAAGLRIDECRMFHRNNTPSYIRFDGRENVMLLATKISN